MPRTHLHEILDLARWAPSGDNTQPWRFEILGDEHVLVHGLDTHDHCVYDLDGHASQMAVGALLETISLAATAHGRRAHVARRQDTPDTHLLIDVRFEPDADTLPDPLVPYIKQRTVQRRAMSTRPLEEAHKAALAASVPGYRLVWFEGLARRWELARFMAANGKNRLTMPEAYPTHRDVIEWNARYSEDRIPEQAVGVDPMTARLMRWALASWRRVDFLNTWFAGTVMPRLQLDLLPGLRCGAHLALLAEKAPASIDDYISAGRALQRLWLSATALGLFMQPEMTPVIFSRYVREGRPFTVVEAVNARGRRVAARMEAWLGADGARQTVFMGRVGYGPGPRSRSLRKPTGAMFIR